jgi:outer membrane immunogenic protein
VKRALGSVAFLVMLAGVASAAEMPVKAPPVFKAPPPPPAATWSGFYVGGNFGYGVGRARSVVAESDGEVDFDSRLSPAGIIGGGQAGYRF